MSGRRSVLYILLTVLGIILLYNYVIAPALMQYGSRMGMGMHWRMYGQTNYYVDLRLILLIALAVAGILLFELLKPQTRIQKCPKCEKEIQSERWRICPSCGTRVNKEKG